MQGLCSPTSHLRYLDLLSDTKLSIAGTVISHSHTLWYHEGRAVASTAGLSREQNQL